MKRKDFLKRLGLGIGVAIIAPQVLATKEKLKGKYLNPPDVLPINYDVSRTEPLYGDNKTGIWTPTKKEYEIGETRFIGIRYWDKDGNSHTSLINPLNK